jgi:hypothetical protein
LCILRLRERKIARPENQDFLKDMDAQDDHLEKGSLEYWEIEQMAKQICTHRCAFNFDRGFCNGHILELKKEEEVRWFLIVDTSFVVAQPFFVFVRELECFWARLN